MNCIDEAVKIEESFGVNVRGQALAILKKIADLENIEEAWSDYGNDIIQDEFRGCEGHMSRLQIATLKEAELIDNLFSECPNNLKSLDDIEKILIKN